MRCARFVLVIALIVGCSSHHRLSAGPTYRSSDHSFGGELTGELASGDGPLFLVASATGRAGHDLTAGALRLGLEAQRAPSPWGVRATATAGVTLLDTRGDRDVGRFDGRGSIAVVRGFAPSTDPSNGDDTQLTVGIDLFANVIGISGTEVLFGIGLTFGWYTERLFPFAASGPRRGIEGAPPR